MNSDKLNITEAIGAYFQDTNVSCVPYGSGHINNTFLIITNTRRYILQHMNRLVFPYPEKVMENILGITEHIRKRYKAMGEDTTRCTLNIIPTLDGNIFFTDSNGQPWRLLDYTEGTVAKDTVECIEDFYNCAKAFGNFQQALSDYPAHLLHETIADFHNTPKRYENLMRAVKNDVCGRLAEVREDVEFARQREAFCHILEDAHKSGQLPLRVTHNDTKLNNILFDKDSGKAICVIDLDTVMPGYSVTDFGDSIRFGANTAAEDETDLSKVSLDLELFEAYAKGFIKGCNGSLTPTELDLLPIGAMMMTLECGMRFLTDHLEGDVYFKIHRPDHNIERARNQFALFADMERKLPQMKNIIEALK